MSTPDEDTKYSIDQMLEALGSSTRREIIYLLRLQSYSISDLSKILEFSLPAVSKHIKLLHPAGLIAVKKNGQKNILSLNKEAFSILKNWLPI